MSLQYISDDSGNTTAVIIPIAEWNDIVDGHPDLKKLTNPQSEDKKSKKKPSDFKEIFSRKEGERFHKYLNKVRKEWDRDFY